MVSCRAPSLQLSICQERWRELALREEHQEVGGRGGGPLRHIPGSAIERLSSRVDGCTHAACFALDDRRERERPACHEPVTQKVIVRTADGSNAERPFWPVQLHPLFSSSDAGLTNAVDSFLPPAEIRPPFSTSGCDDIAALLLAPAPRCFHLH
jgi:hypothetical protein